MVIEQFAFFKHMIANWVILQPNIGNVQVISHVECAVLCLLQQKCATINIMQDDENIMCQMTRRKAVCMEKEEAVIQDGCLYLNPLVSQLESLRQTRDSQRPMALRVPGQT
jgi:hypothetical protein